jgi:hypothetical protein
MMPIMRTQAVLSCLLAAILFVAAALMASPLEVDARAGHEHHVSSQAIAGHQHHAGHGHRAPLPQVPAHQHDDGDVPVSCTSICCAAGLCWSALMTVSAEVGPFYGRIRFDGLSGEVLTGTEPPVPLRPPRPAA